MSRQSQPNEHPVFRGSPVQHDSFDEALSANVLESAQPVKAIAADMGVRPGLLYDAANPNREDTHFQARLIPALTKASGSDALIVFLAHACGGMFVRLARGKQPDAHTGEVLRAAGDYLHEIAQAHADGQITVGEARRIRRKVYALIDVALSQLDVIEAQAARAEVRPS